MTVCLPDGSLSFLIYQLSFDFCSAKIQHPESAMSVNVRQCPLMSVNVRIKLKVDGVEAIVRHWGVSLSQHEDACLQAPKRFA